MKKLLLVLVGLFAWASVAFAAVNINTASKTELESIKGIGPVKAQAIIDYRTGHGSFKSIDELDNVKGIGKGTLGKIRGDVSLSGNTAPAIAKPNVAPAVVPTAAKSPVPPSVATPVKPASPATAAPAKPAAMAKEDSAKAKDSAKSDAGKDKKAQDKKTEKKADAKAKKKDAVKEKP